jgi:monothiol glutaredoxin
LRTAEVRVTQLLMPLDDKQRADLDKLVHSHPTVLFMKGNRRFPQCGFSATVVGILDKVTSGYETVNILDNPAVREGMKEFSSWPTFPQLYVQGEFVGGCDIVKAMYASGELHKLFGAEREPVKPPVVTITPAAAAAFKGALGETGGEVLRLEIDAGYDSGLLIGPREGGDIAVESSGVTVHVEAGSASRAEGITIDYVEGPSGMAFKITNPNQPARVRPIGAKDLKALLDAGRVQLFDVRPDVERARASIAQARKLDAEGHKTLSGLAKDTPIALHCHHGMRSRAAAEELLREGFTTVYNLEGGIEAWSNEVDPSVPHY